MWLPAVGFGALLTSIDSANLSALIAGAPDERLIVSQSNADRLRQYGLVLHSRARIVPDKELFYALWRDKLSYTLLPFNQFHLRLRPLWLDDIPVVDQLADYPLIFNSDRPNFSREKLTRVTLSGTTALARHTLPALEAMGIEQAASGIGDYVRRADFFQITHEASIAPTCPQPPAAALGNLCMLAEPRAALRYPGCRCGGSDGQSHQRLYDAFSATLTHFEDRGFALVGGGRKP